jgi:hypothetical protein
MQSVSSTFQQEFGSMDFLNIGHLFCPQFLRIQDQRLGIDVQVDAIAVLIRILKQIV